MAWITLLRRPVAALAAAGLFLLSGCGGSKSTGDGSSPPADSITVTVKVNYTRIPLVFNANGVPTGLEQNSANFKNLPARGVQVRIWQAKDETNPDGTKARVWLTNISASTDSTGSATLTGVPKDTDAFVEVLSVIPLTATVNVRIVADPNGVHSSLPVGERLVYALRKGVDGGVPAGNPLPAGKASTSTTLTFDVGLSDKWWLTLLNSNQIGNAALESTGTGSRVLAILDSIYAFSSSGIGSSNPGDSLDLHYRMGLSDPLGTFIEYDRAKFPLSFDSTSFNFRYFGSIRGSQSNDDAFDEGILYTLFARNGLWTSGISSSFPTSKALPDFVPEAALIDSLPYAMAATVLKSPYIADTTPSSVSIQDVRSLGSFSSGPYSGPSIAGLAWDLTLKANSLPIPGTPTDWIKIDPKVMIKFYGLIAPVDPNDGPGIFSQLGRLKEAKTSIDPVDLAAIFTDPVLTSISEPFNIPWPRPSSGPYAPSRFDWGINPNSLSTPLPFLSFSMAKAVSVNGAFPNVSSGEIKYAHFTLDKDTPYNVKVATVPAELPLGASLEITFPIPNLTFSYTGSASPAHRVVLRGLKDAPVQHNVRVRLVSPNNLAPDITATVSLDLAN